LAGPLSFGILIKCPNHFSFLIYILSRTVSSGSPGWGVGQWVSTPLLVKILTIACNSQRQSKPDGFEQGRLKLRKSIMRIATWNVQSISNKLKEVVAELEKYRIDIATPYIGNFIKSSGCQTMKQ
jgi:hypothetical protein